MERAPESEEGSAVEAFFFFFFFFALISSHITLGAAVLYSLCNSCLKCEICIEWERDDVFWMLFYSLKTDKMNSMWLEPIIYSDAETFEHVSELLLTLHSSWRAKQTQTISAVAHIGTSLFVPPSTVSAAVSYACDGRAEEFGSA